MRNGCRRVNEILARRPPWRKNIQPPRKKVAPPPSSSPAMRGRKEEGEIAAKKHFIFGRTYGDSRGQRKRRRKEKKRARLYQVAPCFARRIRSGDDDS